MLEAGPLERGSTVVQNIQPKKNEIEVMFPLFPVMTTIGIIHVHSVNP